MASDPPPEQPPAKKPGVGVKIARGVGEVLVTLGIVILLFVFYVLYVTNWMSAGKQAEATDKLDDKWRNERALNPEPLAGESFARLYIPSFGVDYKYAIQEGTGTESLDLGPGHYTGTAMPGEPGNFAIAGHRDGKGAPFNDLDLLESCDSIIAETADSFYVYRVLPKKEEVGHWANGPGKRPLCGKVQPLRAPDAPDGGLYGDTYGQEIVDPSQGEVINPIPNRPEDAAPPAQQAALLTLTTCHPRFSDRERLIIHAVLVKQYAKAEGKSGELPKEMTEAQG
ncbi:LPXTG-site transpeptidase (sortase) family protein [Tamaricihabitans halophyticus]|uniref:LPXTG-site transpeptidase (Sortase) family protein n=1 Tax=Tamaricihabitans halophyticus TaxID=1262583 RepID=A0A4R2QWG8_9PSEU|nr:LPXTG-site transpeptidase (sortase) family protein [Tamaricihabitans halophyticus]